MDTSSSDTGTSDQPLGERGDNRSRRPDSRAFLDFVMSRWAPADGTAPDRAEVAPWTAARRLAVSRRYPGERVVVPAGRPRVRSNDTDYRFRAHSAFAHLTGLGGEHEPEAVLVLEPVAPGTGDDGGDHHAVLYFRPRVGRDTPEFFSDAHLGEFWVGPRPSTSDLEAAFGIECRDLVELGAALAKDLSATPGGVRVRVVRGVDAVVDALVDRALDAAGLTDAEERSAVHDAVRDDELAEFLSELRLVKDDYEVGRLRAAIESTLAGFEDVIRALPRAVAHRRGERVVEGAFGARAREEGNGLGYETIAAAGDHATTLHWTRNDGPVRPGDLVLVDAGVEDDSLYTADVTRTLPVDGRFTAVQRRVYEAVRAAADAAFAEAGAHASRTVRFRDVHDAAMRVIAQVLDEWGLLPVSADEALAPSGQQHRRWMVHGTSHHLGLDVHDCAQARREMYQDAVIVPGMVFTIEPGLYFKADDLAVPAEYRGIGIRIEDDVLVTEDGVERLTAAVPRTADDVEAWMARLLP